MIYFFNVFFHCSEVRALSNVLSWLLFVSDKKKDEYKQVKLLSYASDLIRIAIVDVYGFWRLKRIEGALSATYKFKEIRLQFILPKSHVKDFELFLWQNIHHVTNIQVTKQTILDAAFDYKLRYKGIFKFNIQCWA